MKVQITRLFALLLFVGSFSTMNAQIKTPRPSPNSTLIQDVGLTKVTIDYSRPGIKGRTIFAKDGLVPYGKVWRLGANAATKFTFSDDVKLAGNEVKKGSYAVLATPGASMWKFNLYPYESSNWGSYLEKEAVLSFTVKSEKIPTVIETFLIDVNNIKNASATIDITWESTYVAIPLEVEVDSRVEANIKEVLAGPSADDYYAAGSYYHAAGKDLETALKWVQKATKSKDPKFWQVRREALILADLGRYDEAVQAAMLSMELATKAGNDDYVAMNKKSIAEWTKK